MAHDHKGDWYVCNHLKARNFSLECAPVITSLSNLSLDKSSPSNILFTGSTGGQVVTLGDATKYQDGHEYRIFNESDNPIDIRNFDGDLLGSILPGTYCKFVLCGNSTTGGNWLHGNIQLSKILIDETNISGVSGGDTQTFIENYLSIVGIPIKNEVAEGQKNCFNLVYTTTYEFIPDTLEVFLDGNKLTQGLDFIEALDHMGFTIILDPASPNRLASPPRDDEDLVVSYCRRVIF